MIKAIFPEGVTAMTVNGLHQWDYGQTLQIKASGLPALVEVHFACEGMNEAVVRSCAVTSETLTAAIPDICLEQTSPVMAWVYLVGASSGITTLTVTLPVIARARPQPNATIPTTTSDKYTEAVAAMNAAIASVVVGNVTVARAIADADGKNIPNTYATKTEVKGELLTTDILAKVKEILETGGGGQDDAYLFRLGGELYEKDENGKSVNLPDGGYNYSYATVYTFYDTARVYLWGCTFRNVPPCYNNYHLSSDTWDGWVEMIDAKNIGEQTVKRAQYVQVPLKITVGIDDDDGGLQPYMFADITYYQDGVKKTIDGTIYREVPETFDISVDLGSTLSLSNDYGNFLYAVSGIPLVQSTESGAEGAYDSKRRFIVIGGGTADFEVNAKG